MLTTLVTQLDVWADVLAVAVALVALAAETVRSCTR